MTAPDRIKNCPRCKAPFICQPGNVQACQCAGIRLSEAAKQFISSQYTDCLCRDCLLAITVERSSQTSIKPGTTGDL
jgi:hypothetical protein